MLRVTTIYASAAGSAADYYTKYLADSPGEAPGEWSGRQAAVLGLAGEVSGDDLRALLEGRDPVSGTPLGRTFADRTLANGKVVRAVAGFDATFSAPKSLSVLWALTQDDRLLDAHEVAVRAALDHLERYGATTRVRSRNGRLHPDAIGLTMATFRQTTSRSDDPQIHTHAVISSKVQTDDHSWLALDARYLKRYQRMLGGLYQSVLRNELAHLFGAGWAPIEHGQAEMLGVPAELCEAFSKRSVQVERAIVDKRADFIDRQGREPNRWELAALKREAAADTRTSKTGNAVTDLTTRWANEAAALGWTGPELRLAAVQAGIGHGVGQAGVRLDEIVATLSTGGSTWNRADVVSAVCDIVTPNRDVDGAEWAQMIERVADAAIERCVDLDPTNCGGPRRRSDGRSLWLEPTASHITTNEILSEEELVLSWALDAQTDEPAPSHSVDAGRLDVLQAEAHERSPASTASCSSSARPEPARRPHCGPLSKTCVATAAPCSEWHRQQRLPGSSNARPACPPTHSPSCSTSGSAPTGRLDSATSSRPERPCSSTRPAWSARLHSLAWSASRLSRAGGSRSSAIRTNSRQSAEAGYSTNSA
jgi:conjugative relaxase-like TrwC/TraI family protein